MPRPSSPLRPVVALLAAIVLVSSAPARAEEPPPSETAPTPLEAVVERLGEETQSFDGSASFGISVLDLDTGEQADFQGDQWIKMASSLKVAWLAAAIREAGFEAVEPYGESVMVWSINEAAGRTIALAGGVDEINAMTLGLGMNGTLLVEWTTGTFSRSKYYPGEHPWLNYTTANDLVTFWRWLSEGQVLPTDETEALLEWGRIPKQGALATMMARLPDEVDQWFSYKMGVLPPGRSKLDPDGNEVPIAARDTILGGGVIEIPGGPRYAFSVATMGGYSWWGKVQFVEYASCRIYEVMANQLVGCDRPGDPARTRLDTDPPFGALTALEGTAEFLTVRGWAMDPDDPFGTILTRFTVDGAWATTTRAAERHSWGAGPAIWDGHGFETTLLTVLAPGSHEVCAVGINDGSGDDQVIGCQTITIR